MERQFPKNVRQIGNVSDNPKIYVEDYVDTFFSQLCDKVEEEPVGAFLIGETVQQQEDEDCIYIHGAVQIKEIGTKGADIEIAEEVWKSACEECKEYFAEGEILGWFLTLPGQAPGLNDNLKKIHEKRFPEKNTILIMKDPVEKEEMFFANKFHDLMEIGGHYIYYEKNPAMQNYMIAHRKKIGVTPSEDVEDRVTKDFRSIVNERMSDHQQKHTARLTYAASTFLILVVLVIGVTTINNYDKMQSVQSTLDVISRSVTGGKKDEPSKETSGEVKEGETITPQPSENKEAAKEKPASSSPTSTTREMSEDYYVVTKGDTLASISKKLYGDTSHVEAICKMNGLKNGNLIFIGQKLLLP